MLRKSIGKGLEMVMGDFVCVTKWGELGASEHVLDQKRIFTFT